MSLQNNTYHPLNYIVCFQTALMHHSVFRKRQSCSESMQFHSDQTQSCSAEKLVFGRCKLFPRRCLYIELTVAQYNTDPVSSTHNMPGRRGWHGSQNAETSECIECCFVLLVCAQNFVGELSAEFSNLFPSSPPNGHMHTMQVISCHGDSV